MTLRVSMSFLQPTYCGMNVRPIIKCNAIPNLMSQIVTFFLFLHKIAQRFSYLKTLGEFVSARQKPANRVESLGRSCQQGYQRQDLYMLCQRLSTSVDSGVFFQVRRNRL